MKNSNPNCAFNRLKRHLQTRWSQNDYPGSSPVFDLKSFGKDLLTYLALPIGAIVFYKFVEGSVASPRRQKQTQQVSRETQRIDQSKSQIIEFSGGSTKSGGGRGGSAYVGLPRRSPGSLVKVRLMNVVETYSTAPVHAQIIDAGLGKSLMGGILLGDATPDTTFERINIGFRFAKDPNRDEIAAPIAARALSLDGTLGLNATKKEGFFARAAVGSGAVASQDAQGAISGGDDFKQILFRALTAGLVQEFGSGAQVEKNRANVLSLPPSTEFFAELTDYFPGAGK